MVFVLNYIEASTELKHHRHGRHTAGGVESRETNAHGEDAFSVAGDHVLLARDHEGIIVLEQWQPLTPYYSLYKYIMRQSINPKSRIFQQLRISRQRLYIPQASLREPPDAPGRCGLDVRHAGSRRRPHR